MINGAQSKRHILYLAALNQKYTDPPLQMVTASTVEKDSQETCLGAEGKTVAPKVSERKGKQVSQMVKLENMQIKQADKFALSQKYPVFTKNFPFHSKTSKYL